MAKIAPSPVLGKASGAYFGVVVANGRNGLVMRRAPRYRRAQSDLQREAALRMSTVAALWPDLPTETVLAWNAYAETLHRRDRVTGQDYSPTGFNAFTGLACKVLQVDPSAEVPPAPPTGVFLGDALALSVDAGALGEAAGTTGKARGRPDLHLSTRASRSGDVIRGTGVVRWTADVPNSPGTVCELMWEKLPNKNRKPTKRWRTAGFHHFAQGAMSVETPAGPGWYVAGYRYVEAATGRVVGGWTIRLVEVLG